MIRYFLFLLLLSNTVSAQEVLDKENKLHAQVIGDWTVNLEETAKVFKKSHGQDNKKFLSSLPLFLFALSQLKLSITAKEVKINDGDYLFEIKEVVTKENEILFPKMEGRRAVKGLYVLANGGLKLITDYGQHALFVWHKKSPKKEDTEKTIKNILSRYKGVGLKIDVTRYIRLKQYDALEELLKEKPEYANYVKEGSNRTVLHEACSFKRFKYIKLLLEHGADPNAKIAKGSYDSGKTPLHFIVKSFDPDDIAEWKLILDLFIKYKVNLDLKDNNGCTALMASMDQDVTLKGEELCKYLIEKGADTKIVDKKMEDFWHKVCSLGADESFIEYLEDKKILLSFKENIFGLTPIDLAIRFKRIDFLKALIKNGYKIIKPKSDGLSMLYMAIFDLGTMKFLVENVKGINLEASSIVHGTPLRRAMRAGKVDVVKYLLLKGAKIPKDYDSTKVTFRPAIDYPAYYPIARGRRVYGFRKDFGMFGLFCIAEVHAVIKAHLDKQK